MQEQKKEKLYYISGSGAILSKMEDQVDKLSIEDDVKHLCAYESELKHTRRSTKLAILIFGQYIDSFLQLVDLFYKYYELGPQYFTLLEAAIDGMEKNFKAMEKKPLEKDATQENAKLSAELSKYYGRVAIIFKTAADNTSESYFKPTYEKKAKDYCELAYQGSHSAAKSYLEKICELYEKEANLRILSFIKGLLLHRAGDLRLPKAIQEGDLETVRSYVDQFDDLMDKVLPNANGRTAFLEAIYHGKLKLVEYFVTKRDVLALLKLTDDSGHDAFTLAQSRGHVAISKYLLELKKAREERLKLTEDIDKLLEAIKPYSGNKVARIDALASLKEIVLSAAGKITLQEDDKIKQKIVHILQLKIEFDLDNDVQDAAADLLTILRAKPRPSVSEGLKVTSERLQVSNLHAQSESTRLLASSHQLTTAPKVIARSQGVQASGKQRGAMELDSTSLATTTATTMASFCSSASYPSFWSGSSSSGIHDQAAKQLYTDIYQRHLAALSANASFSASDSVSSVAKALADAEFQKLFT